MYDSEREIMFSQVSVLQYTWSSFIAIFERLNLGWRISSIGIRMMTKQTTLSTAGILQSCEMKKENKSKKL